MKRNGLIVALVDLCYTLVTKHSQIAELKHCVYQGNISTNLSVCIKGDSLVLAGK
jgi:hypothetical protein